MQEEISEDYGHVVCPEGEVKIKDFIQTENIHGRQWTLTLLEDDSIVMFLESRPERSYELIKQQLRLTKKTFAILLLALTKADTQFNVRSEELLHEMLIDDQMEYKKPCDESPQVNS